MYSYRLSTSLKKELQHNTSSLVTLSNLQKHVLTYQTRNPDYWQIPTCRLNVGKEMLAYRVPRLLNSLILHNIDIDKLSLNELRSVMYTFDVVY